eukprot:CAMPEP_0170493846 /NCGR_PEP_ID=MMETSP0208-20121228/14302_1 /TAXON_ID=197538 /ORGANISM="Strombidium inclinatum, Strain S3" /LENGTH=125 /DNA_ID=CAMNT_0010769821 /DNA_START=162 /DNA_END=540 /DNA_ORIENTATION=+
MTYFWIFGARSFPAWPTPNSSKGEQQRLGGQSLECLDLEGSLCEEGLELPFDKLEEHLAVAVVLLDLTLLVEPLEELVQALVINIICEVVVDLHDEAESYEVLDDVTDAVNFGDHEHEDDLAVEA